MLVELAHPVTIMLFCRGIHGVPSKTYATHQMPMLSSLDHCTGNYALLQHITKKVRYVLKFP